MKNFTLTCLSLVLSIGLSAQTQIDLPITWDDGTVNYTTIPFGGSSSSMVAADPVNAANMALQYVKPVDAPTWAGVTLGNPALASVIPFDINNNTISVDVYSPDAGIEVRLKAEVSGNPTQSVETNLTTTVANGWETLVFDFTNESNGTAAINYAFNFNMLSIFFNFGVDGATAGAKTYYCDNIIFGGSGNPPNDYSVTFQVDMNQFAGSFTTPEVNGTFNGWCGNCNALTDANGDNIWETTVVVQADSIEYKFSYDSWTGEEALTEGSACTKTTGAFTNRFLQLTGDTILPAVCWESCATCAGGPEPVDTNSVTFRVDMRGYTGTYTTPEVNGTFNGWCGNCNPLTDVDNDSIWETTIDLTVDTIEYKFSHDAWTGQETLDSSLACVLTTIDGSNVFVNRYLVIQSDTVLPVVCWESCEACVADTTVGVFNIANLELNLYPNPSNGIINIETASFESYSITMMDALGKVVYSTNNVNNTLETIDVSSFENGIYMVILRADNNVHTSKVMVSK